MQRHALFPHHLPDGLAVDAVFFLGRAVVMGCADG
jgi:hypothetical protein